jgi:O-antigen ligase
VGVDVRVALINGMLRARGPAPAERLPGWIRGGFLGVVAALIALLSYSVVGRVGAEGLSLVLGGILGLCLLTYVSQKNLSLSVSLWLLSMSGFRLLGLVSMPVLPDFTFDRLFLVFIGFVLALRMISHPERLQGPYHGDALVTVHTIYVLLNILILAPEHYHAWVLSSLSPFFAFLLGKYAFSDDKAIRNILLFFVCVSIYFYVTSIAEHFGWTWLVWPKAILDPNGAGLWQPGRSRGPILHPPLFGQMQAMFLLVHLYFFSRPLKVILRMLLSLSLIGCFLGLYFAYTRAPFIALAAGMVTLAVLLPRFRRTLLVLLVVAGLAQAVFSFKPEQDQFLEERLHTTGTFDNRLMMIANSLRIVQDYPVFGIGLFKAKDHLWEYNRGTNIPFYGYVRGFYGGKMVPHDIYISRIAEEGLFSGGVLFAFTVVIVRAFRRRWRANPQDNWFNRDTLALFAAIIVCYLVGGMAIDYRYFDLVNAVAFLLAGIIYGGLGKQEGAQA